MEKNEILDIFKAVPEKSGTIFQFDWNGEPPDIKVFSILDKLRGLNQKSAVINYGGNDVFSDEWWVNLKSIAEAAEAKSIRITLRENKADGGNYINNAVLDKHASLVKKELVYSVQSTYLDREIYIIPKNAVSVTAYTLKNGIIDGSTASDLRALTSGSFLRFLPVRRNTLIVSVCYKEIFGETDRLNKDTIAREKELFWEKLNTYMPEKLGTVLNDFCLIINKKKEKLYTDKFISKFIKYKKYDPSKFMAALFIDIGKQTEQIRLDYYDVINRIAAEEYYLPIEKWLNEHNISYYSLIDSTDDVKIDTMYSAVHGCSGIYKDETVSQNNALSIFNSLAYAGVTPVIKSDWITVQPELIMSLSARQSRLNFILTSGKNSNSYAVWYPEATKWAETEQDKAVEITSQVGETLKKLGQEYDFINDRMLISSKSQNGEIHFGKDEYRVIVIPGLYSVFNAAFNKIIEFLKNDGIVLLIDDEPRASESGGKENEKLSLLCRELLGGKYAYLDKRGLIFCMDMVEFTAAVENLDLRDIISDIEIKYQHRRLNNTEIFILYDPPIGKLCKFRATGSVEMWNAQTGDECVIYPQREDKEYTSLNIPFYTGGTCIIVFDRSEEVTPVLTKGIDSILSFNENEVTASFVQAGHKRAYVQKKNIAYVLKGDTEEEQRIIELDGKWSFFIDQSDTQVQINSFNYKGEKIKMGSGAKMMLLGGFPIKTETVDIERELINMPKPDLEDEYIIDGKTYRWTEYSYSDTIRQFDEYGRYICDIPNMLAINLPDSKSYLWTSIYAEQEDQIELICPDKPRRMYINGAYIDSNRRITLKKGINNIVLRYDGACNTYVIFKSMTLMEDANPSGMYEYPINAYPYKPKETAKFSFTAPPMMYEMSICAYNEPTVFYGENECLITDVKEYSKGASEYIIQTGGLQDISAVKIIIKETGNHYGGGLICAPIKIKCNTGELELCNINIIDSLTDYYGVLSYTKKVNIDKLGARAFIDLGNVVGAALIKINGNKAGLLMQDPYIEEITNLLVEGENEIEATLYSCKDEIVQKGLIGPVKLIIEGKIVLNM